MLKNRKLRSRCLISSLWCQKWIKHIIIVFLRCWYDWVLKKWEKIVFFKKSIFRLFSLLNSSNYLEGGFHCKRDQINPPSKYFARGIDIFAKTVKCQNSMADISMNNQYFEHAVLAGVQYIMKHDKHASHKMFRELSSKVTKYLNSS